MPPRRSSRSTRASVEPVSEGLPTSKRKRGSIAESDGTSRTRENNTKPTSKAGRKVSATRSSVAASRRKQSMDDVQEVDEEESDAPPTKKSKATPDDEESDGVVEATEDESEEEQKQRRKRPGTRSERPSRRDTVEEAPSDEGLSKPPTRGSRSSKVKPPASEKPAQGSSRSRTSRATVISDEDEDASPPAPKGRRPSAQPTTRRASGRRSAAPEPIVKSEKDEPATHGSDRSSVQPSHKRSTTRRATAPEPIPESDEDEAAGEQPSAPSAAEVRASSDDEANEVAAHLSLGVAQASDDDIEPMPASPRKQRVRMAPPPPVDYEEEEMSLLEPEIPKLPASQPRTQAVPEEPQGPAARLVIHKLVLINFKSYAGRQEIGPFHKSFSAIVGPNGSGKSNTIDALLFVFGYRASKMRQGKLSELIHNSANYEDLDFCTVEVHFREIIDLPGPDAFDVVPNSSLVIARTAYTNNSSKYTINSQQSNFKEVTTLLKGRGIDLDHKRFLILQGEVESIALMKPKAATEHEDGLLEYLEDIIGTSRYKEPIEEALQEMDRLSEDRVEKLNRLRITEREKNTLEEQKKEAENYLRLQNELVRSKSRLWQWYIWKCFQTNGEFEKKINIVSKELQDERDRNKDDIEHLELLEKDFNERQKVYEEMRAAAAEVVKELAGREKQEVKLQEFTKAALAKFKKLEKSIKEDEKARTEATRAIEDNASKITKERSKLEDLEADLEQEEKVLEGITESLKDKTQVFHDQIEAKQKELQPWTKKINEKQAKIDVAQSEHDSLVKKAEAAQIASEEAEATLEQLKEAHESKEKELETRQNDREQARSELSSNQKKLQGLKTRVEDLRGKAASKRQRVDEAKSSQSQATSQNRVLDSLTKLKARGQITGFHGRLGALGTIPDKYDVAVSTACPALYNMVVDTVEQGQQCIEYLRKQNVGRASFMILDKLDKHGGSQKIQTPENVPRLFDLIKPKDPRFSPAFYKALRDTLVANDLDQANRIAFGGQKRYRVVTLAGQLIDASGTMSGGGTSVSKGAMSSKLAPDAVPPELIRTYEEESQTAQQDLETAVGQLRALESEIDRLEREGPSIDTALGKINLDLQTSQKNISEAQRRLKELRLQTKPDSGDLSRIAQLEKEIAAHTKELKELQSRTAVIEDAIKALEKKILEIGGSRLLAQKSKVDGLRLHISLANDEITKAEVAKAKAEKDTAKLASNLKAHTTGLEEAKADLEEHKAELSECTAVLEELRTKVEEVQAEEEASKEKFEALKEALDEKTAEVQGFKKKEAELQRTLDDVKKDLAENEKVMDHWQREHDNLKLEDVDEGDEEDAEGESAGNGDGEHVMDDAPNSPQPGPHDETRAKHKTSRRSHTPVDELHTYSAEELAGFKKQHMQGDIAMIEDNLKNLNPNLNVLKEYQKREEEFLRRAKDLDDTTAQRDAQKQTYDSLRKQRLDEFMAGFNSISLKLKEMYQMITLGGNAELELVDSMDPFSEGIIFSVMPPKKSWKNISNLSGGEKTLSSLALVFALHHFKPTPLYFMDEIDAALDFRNVSIVANYIKDRTKNAQFIIISLRNDMFELSHRLIGIYKTANTTKSLSIDNHSLNAAPVRTAPVGQAAA